MFSAVLRGKAGRWFENARGRAGRPWRDAVRIEDSLTALVFDALSSVPGTTVAHLLCAAASPSLDLTWLEADGFNVEFWPRVASDVEPDVLLIDERQQRLLIVESKHGAMQSVAQLEREMTAASDAYPEYTLQLLAAGGDNVFSEIRAVVQRAQDGNLNMGAFGWRSLTEAVRERIGTTPSAAERRCLGALLEGLEWFGYRRIPGFLIEKSLSSVPIERLRGLSWVPTERPVTVAASWSLDGIRTALGATEHVAEILATWRITHG